MPLSFAIAQNVPAIQVAGTANAAANTTPAGGASATASASSTPTIVSTGDPGAAKANVPPGWPPALTVTAPPVALDQKEKAAVKLATAWRDRPERPMRDADGVLRWMVSSSQARLVCAPLQMCDVELKPGEAVNNIRIGDTAFWTVTLAISGGMDGRTTHVSISPKDAGRSTSMVIYTDQRTYSLKLVSTQSEYTPKTGFIYGDSQQDQQDNFASYRAAVAAGALKKNGPVPASSGSGNMDADKIEILTIEGDNPSWRPTVAYTDGRKTYIQFPTEMQFGDSPSLLGVNDDGGLFTAPTERRVIYRVQGNRLIADTVMGKLELVLGVGSNQRKVMIVRRRG